MLMFTVGNVLDITVPTSPAVFALVILFSRRACFSDVTTVDVQGQNVAALPSTLWAESRIIKFAGTLSACMQLIIEASRVGNQCLIPGVKLHTSKIFFK